MPINTHKLVMQAMRRRWPGPLNSLPALLTFSLRDFVCTPCLVCGMKLAAEIMCSEPLVLLILFRTSTASEMRPQATSHRGDSRDRRMKARIRAMTRHRLPRVMYR